MATNEQIIWQYLKSQGYLQYGLSCSVVFNLKVNQEIDINDFISIDLVIIYSFGHLYIF